NQVMDEPAAADTPDQPRVVEADGEEIEAVGRELDVGDGRAVSGQRVEQLARRGVPQLRDVALRGCDPEAAGRERCVLGRRMDRADELAVVGVAAALTRKRGEEAAATGGERENRAWSAHIQLPTAEGVVGKAHEQCSPGIRKRGDAGKVVERTRATLRGDG